MCVVVVILYKIFARSFKSNSSETIRRRCRTFQGCSSVGLGRCHHATQTRTFESRGRSESTINTAPAHFVSCRWELCSTGHVLQGAMGCCRSCSGPTVVGATATKGSGRRSTTPAQALNLFGSGPPVQVIGFDRHIMKYLGQKSIMTMAL
jgi:hypothetical protein